MHSQYMVKTTDMHTAGEPLRIIESIQPAVTIIGNDILAKIEYMKTHLDWIRKLIIDEPRGHRDMYGALLLDPAENENYDFAVIFMHNNGYSTMCGHGIIALARYAIDKNIVRPYKQSMRIMCPCGIVECSVEEINTVAVTTFVSVPSFLMCSQLKFIDAKLGPVSVDISYGGAFYAIVNEKDLGVKIGDTDLHNIISLANSLKSTIIKTIKMEHPSDARLEFLYGIIIVQDVEVDEIHRNLVIFANKEVDRSPCGSGVSAQLAALYSKNSNRDCFKERIKFQNALLREKSHFTARVKNEIKLQCSDKEITAVQVEVTGCAFYTGRQEFFYESNDPLKDGFQIYL